MCYVSIYKNNHLSSKIKKTCITSKLWYRIRAHFSGRYQCVRINSVRSDLLPVLSGVPQGSILEPLLFTIYVNDLPPVMKNCSVLMFKYTTCFLPLHSRKNYEEWSQMWKLEAGFQWKEFVYLHFNQNASYLLRIFHWWANHIHAVVILVLFCLQA